MYRVRFVSKLNNKATVGDVIVCAGNAEQAEDLVVVNYDLPRSSSSFEINRVKPSLYEVSMITKKADLGPSMATFPDGEESRFTVEAAISVWAKDAAAAIVKLSMAIKSHCKDVPQRNETFSVICNPEPSTPKPSAVEQNAIFKSLRMFQGGAARPR